ncbi:MAG: hypothetical protein QOI05_2202 [Bradyrhizobium sp.]|jgi:uncharacterized protein with HEPN domain|nr:hypothetical protein [Bradyrhizobium sp.]
MPPTVEDRLSDIREAISQIERITSNMTLEQFASDVAARAATERFLEVVCEASRHLSDDIKQQEPRIAWRKMVDFGNLLRHAYRSTKTEIVWDVVQNDLPALKAFVDRSIRAPK